VIRSACVSRALRFSRASHDRRTCARWARESVGGEEAETRPRTGSIGTSRCWRCRRRQARLCCRRCPSRHRSGADPPESGGSSMLTWRGVAVVLPLHGQCSRNTHGRPSRLLAEGTTRRRPSRSRRCSCGTRALSAGHRRVPSGGRGTPAPQRSRTSRWPVEPIPKVAHRMQEWTRRCGALEGQAHIWWCALVPGHACAPVPGGGSTSSEPRSARLPVIAEPKSTARTSSTSSRPKPPAIRWLALSRSSEAVSRANFQGRRRGNGVTSAPSRMRRVCIAMAECATQGSATATPGSA
jgi:hypothetical protein